MQTSDISIAYMLLVHKNPDQVNKFIEQIIKHEHSDVYVHIDKKSVHFMIDKIMKHPRVYILQDSVSGSWGDISLVDATIKLINAVVDSERKYEFLCLRSGQDMIVKEGYEKYLTENKERNFITVSKIDKSNSYAACVNIRWPKCTRRLYDNMHPFRLLRSLLKYMYYYGFNLFPNKNKLPESFSIYDGSQWFTISMSFGKYIINYLHKNQWYYDAFKDALVPDTCFFQTLIKNSPFSNTVININHVYMRWGSTIKDNNHPVTLTTDDINGIEATDNYFARKFDENVDNEVIKYFYNKVVNSGAR